jgi:formylglycine-generating enzyme required for sulfatase activity
MVNVKDNRIHLIYMEKVKARPAPEKTIPVHNRNLWIAAPVIGLVVIAACVIPSPMLGTPSQSDGHPPVAATASATAAPTYTATQEPSSTPTWTGTEIIEATLTTLPDYRMDDKGVPMAYVPAGIFPMGDDRGNPDEQPIHSVNLDAFYIDKFEVTNGFYKDCVAAKVCQPVRNKSSAIRSYYYENSDFETYPVIFVNWNMAQTYCEWRGARQPTEAEWEKAARGGTNSTYPWGDTLDCNLANYGNCLGDTSSVTIYDLGQSRYGSYHMAGNVSEWVGDWYAANYYQSSPQENPQGPETGKEKVLRGGSWKDNDEAIRSVNREAKNPAYSSNVIGFRCAKDANR